MASGDSVVRSWRTAFLTLRDETLASPPSLSLLQSLLFSQNQASLIAAASDLSPHELASDLIFLLELTTKALSSKTEEADDLADAYIRTCHLIHDVSYRVCLEMNSLSWSLMLDFLQKMLHFFLTKPSSSSSSSANAISVNVVMEILEILRRVENGYGRKCSISETELLVKLILNIIVACNAGMFTSCHSTGNLLLSGVDTGSKTAKRHNLWDSQTSAFVMLGELLLKLGSSMSAEIWQSALEVLRKILDALATKNLLVEDNIMSRFYASLLQCLHLILTNSKGSLSDHVAGLVAALRIFFIYGLTNHSSLASRDASFEVKPCSLSTRASSTDSTAITDRGRYRPPHLRRREGASISSLKADSQSFSEDEKSAHGFTSSDSEHSDSDGLGKSLDYFRSSKTRITAFLCIQDLCQADPKSLIAHWTLLLPTSDVLQQRKYEPTLLTCLLFDPILKARVAAASTLASMLGGPSSVFLRVAEFNESNRRGPFTSLSSSLGQMLMQLHTGILYLIQREAHYGMLVPLFRSLVLLISATPYARMPQELLPSVISSVSSRMMKGFPSRADQNGLLAICFNCLGAAFSTSPPSSQVQAMLQEEISAGAIGLPGDERVLSLIIQFCERIINPGMSLEALQVLRAVSHNYPAITVVCWDQFSTSMYGLLRATFPVSTSSASPSRLLKGSLGNNVDQLGERCILATIKVLDECLRAISGFKGTEDPFDDGSLYSPFTSDCTKTKKISSAPSYGLDAPEVTKAIATSDYSGSVQWSEAIDKHLSLTVFHSSASVRAASVTCFAGITSSAFFSLPIEKQDFVLSHSINAALTDEVPSVRSAGCRAIGVIACFPQISHRDEILDKFIRAVEINTRHPQASVRITACWALANTCDLIRHRADVDLKSDYHWTTLLAECSLRLAKDGDKIKSNAVRALGNLARFVRFTNLPSAQYKQNLGDSSTAIDSICHGPQTICISKSTSLGHPQWLGRMVQAFVSCVTTGNVKVQWNVCHALSNLFLNKNLKLQDMDWAPSVFSILLLLLRDSSNFKIRIHAAAALSVPVSRLDYGSSFADVVQGLQHVLENIGSDQITAPSSFRYREVLQKQLTTATLHVFGLVAFVDHEALKDFLVKAKLIKKSSFLENWLKSLCSSILDESNQPAVEASSSVENQNNASFFLVQKKEMISKAIKALQEFYACNNHQAIAGRIEKLIACVS
ncbi:hypothetical protein Syun_020066 [Stephania yunnanensis]|uniref:DUF4042 domain-containing protein n=1 Tax=Stephania yunnanensis TaxID=152371 RepID=A0AAP0IVD3_9MAGN